MSKIKLNCDIRNVFTIVRENIDTGEKQTYKAHNIILDKMYSRLCNFSTYFVNIHFGTGTGAFDDTTRTSLYTHLGTKTAVEEFQTPAYPTSQWRKRITLLPEEYVSETITEVGVAYGSDPSYLVTHAPIRDAEGNPIALGPKLANEVITIYADIFITLYSPDPGLFFIADGLRNYLLGATMASEQHRISFIGHESADDEDMAIKSASRTVDVPNRKVTSYARFQADEYNKDIRFVDWVNMGVRVELPRTGIFTGKLREGVVLGAGDGVNKIFPVPNRGATVEAVYVDGVELTSGWTHQLFDNTVIIDTPPITGKPVTADINCKYVPKDSNHVFDTTFALTYGVSEPSPVMPAPDYSLVPGESAPIAGTAEYGFWGEVTTAQLISGDDLADALGLTAGISQHSTEPWLKFTRRNRMLLVAKKTFRHSISWNNINAVGAVFGERVIEIGGVKYMVRLLSTSEWNALMYPVHVDYGQWAQYTDEDLLVRSTYGDGSYSWTSTKSDTHRIIRGYGGVTYSNVGYPSIAYANYGFRPCLEVIS